MKNEKKRKERKKGDGQVFLHDLHSMRSRPYLPSVPKSDSRLEIIEPSIIIIIFICLLNLNQEVVGPSLFMFYVSSPCCILLYATAQGSSSTILFHASAPSLGTLFWNRDCRTGL